MACWQLHYVHRSFIYPLRIRASGKRTPIVVAAMAIVFNLVNSYLNARQISEHLEVYGRLVGEMQAELAAWLHEHDPSESLADARAPYVGTPASAASVVRLHTHKMPPFGPGKDERNLREATLAGAMMVALPVSVDGIIHHKEGLAFIKISNKVVQVYEDTGKGLKSTLYVKGPGKE